MADLKFADYEREFIAKNKVDTTYEIGRVSIDQNSDIFTITSYDTNGNPIYYKENTIWGNTTTSKYNEVNFCIEEYTLYRADNVYSITYKFTPDSLKLYQYRNPGGSTTEFLFDTLGREIYENTSHHIKKNTRYNTKGKVSEINYLYDNSGNEGRNFTTQKFNIYYDGGIIDSVIRRNYFVDPQYNYSIKTYYDSLGLKYKKVAWDSVITYYKHVKRK